MGTSKTSSGPGKNVPLVPSWLEPDGKPSPPMGPNSLPPPNQPSSPGTPGAPTPAPPGGQPQPQPSPQPWRPALPPPPLAPARRFTATRRAIGSYAKSGGDGNLRKALGNYVKNGYGGGGTASRRMQKGPAAAGGVYNILSGGQGDGDGQRTDRPLLDVQSLAGLSHREVAERIAEAVNPGNVSLDDAAVREAIADAVSSVLDENQDADITNLPAELSEECYLRTLSNTAFNVIIADIGASLQRGAGNNAQIHNDRLKEVKDYVREVYRSQMAKLKSGGQTLTNATSTAIARNVTAMVMDVFESYIE